MTNTERPFAWMLAEDGRTPIPAPFPSATDEAGLAALFAWLVRWQEGACVVGHEVIDTVKVSTAFLCYDMGYGIGRSLFWETVLIADSGEGAVFIFDRYGTYDEATAGHAFAVAFVRRYGFPPCDK